MPKKKSGLRLHVSGPARRDIAAILKRSLEEFGLDASRRYSALIRQALLDIEVDDKRPGSRERPEIMAGGVRTYHLSFSRTRVSGDRVKEPRHFLLYRRRDDGVVEVGRIFNEARDLARHLPEGFRRRLSKVAGLEHWQRV